MLRIPSWFSRLPGYLWALPASLVGLAFAWCSWRIGARLRFRRGILEVSGRGSRLLLDALAPPGWCIHATTLGHVVLARDRRSLAGTRAHEAVHVRQYECWGVAFLPAYILAAVVTGSRGGAGFLEKPF